MRAQAGSSGGVHVYMRVYACTYVYTGEVKEAVLMLLRIILGVTGSGILSESIEYLGLHSAFDITCLILLREPHIAVFQLIP